MRVNAPFLRGVGLAGSRLLATRLHDLAVNLELREARHQNYRPNLTGVRSVSSNALPLFAYHWASAQAEELQLQISSEHSTPLNEILEFAAGWQGHPLDSQALLSVAITLDQESPKLRIALGANQMRQGKCSAALDSFMVACRLSNDGCTRSRALTNCAAVYERLHDIDAAMKYSFLAVALSPVSPLAAYNHGRLLRRYEAPSCPE